MAEMWKPQSSDTLKHWWQTLMDEASDSLNEWETNFMNSIEYRVERGFGLTERQEKSLEKIYAEKTK